MHVRMRELHSPWGGGQGGVCVCVGGGVSNKGLKANPCGIDQ